MIVSQGYLVTERLWSLEDLKCVEGHPYSFIEVLVEGHPRAHHSVTGGQDAWPEHFCTIHHPVCAQHSEGPASVGHLLPGAQGIPADVPPGLLAASTTAIRSN